MAYEDFTTFTESDEGDDVTIDSATKVSWVNLPSRDVTAYVYKDYDGTGYFDEDYDHLFEMYFDNVANKTYAFHHMLSTVVGDYLDLTGAGGDGVGLAVNDNTETIYLHLVEAGSASTDTWAPGDPDGPQPQTLYYVNATRDDDGGGNSTGQYTYYIRTGSHTGTLKDTLTQDASAGEQNNFRYGYCLATYDNSKYPINYIDGYTQNLDLQEAVAAGAPTGALYGPLVGPLGGPI